MREYGVIYVRIPQSFNDRISEYSEKTIHKNDIVKRKNDLHINIKYGLITEDVKLVKKVLGEFPPIDITFGVTKMFMADDYRDTDVVKIDIFSSALKDLRKRIEKNLETVDVYKTYNPHCTIAYVKKYAGMGYVGCNPIIGEQTTVNEIVFSPPSKEEYFFPCKI